jgi:uncharacterized protein
MIWSRLSRFILNNRTLLLLVVLGFTAFMGWKATQVQISQELARILPQTDPDYVEYEGFKARYGEDGNIMAVGIETDAMYSLAFFNDWHDLNQRIRRIKGIKDVVSNANLFNIVRDDSLQKFRFVPLVPKKLTTQAQVDSIAAQIVRLPFYADFVTDSANRAQLMGITFDQSVLNSSERIAIVREIEAQTTAFARAHNLRVHLSGMPYIRTEISVKIGDELVRLLILAIIVTSVIMLVLFRSPTVMLTTLFVVGLGVVASVGYVVLFDYKITLLSGLIPPLIIVIGIPNAIFLLNRYHEELSRGHEKREALRIAIEKVGETTFFANVTTSIGFFVFYFTNSPLLLQFGLVASLGIMTTYVLSLVLIPILFSYLPVPSVKQRGHLENRWITQFLAWVNQAVQHRRAAIYVTIAVFAVIGAIGMTRLTALGYVVDDLPPNDPLYTDLKFFEAKFKGVLPFEVNIDAKRPGRALDPTTLTKIKVLQREFAKNPEFARPISVIEAVKFFYQAYRGGDPKYYILPPALELAKLSKYAPQLKGSENRFRSYLDSNRQNTRVSFQVADIGTVRLNALIKKLQPKVDSIFNYDPETRKLVPPADRYDAKVTGNSVVFTLGNAYLLENLVESTALAIFLVSIILVILLRDVRLSLIAILPSIVPLIVTAGIMGFANIHLKPSTILIFSIAFGLSSDGTIYFITKYRDELRQGRTAAEAVANTIRYTGVSMFYTAMILFAGFGIFIASAFAGTASLGVLVSITLLMGMASNLILLPAFLLTVDKRRGVKSDTR